MEYVGLRWSGYTIFTRSPIWVKEFLSSEFTLIIVVCNFGTVPTFSASPSLQEFPLHWFAHTLFTLVTSMVRNLVSNLIVVLGYSFSIISRFRLKTPIWLRTISERLNRLCFSNSANDCSAFSSRVMTTFFTFFILIISFCRGLHILEKNRRIKQHLGSRIIRIDMSRMHGSIGSGNRNGKFILDFESPRTCWELNLWFLFLFKPAHIYQSSRLWLMEGFTFGRSHLWACSYSKIARSIILSKLKSGSFSTISFNLATESSEILATYSGASFFNRIRSLSKHCFNRRLEFRLICKYRLHRYINLCKRLLTSVTLFKIRIRPIEGVTRSYLVGHRI